MEIEGQKSNPESDTLKQLSQLHGGGVPAEEPSEPESEEAPAEAAQQTEPESPDVEESQAEKIVIDGQEFSSEKEAYAYVLKKNKDYETELALAQARQEGIEQALQRTSVPQQQTPPPPAEETDDTDEFYADPSNYLKKKTKDIRESVKAELRQEWEQQQADAQLWKEFFDMHPDLDGYKEDCEIVLNKNLETIKVLAQKDRKKAMDYLATRTREKFQNYMERLKPTRTLSNTKQGPSAGVVNGGVTPKKTQDDEELLDFVSQIRRLKA